MRVPLGGRHPCSIMSSVINDVTKIGRITIVFMLLAVLSYPPSSIVVSQVPVPAG
jgi:hypothetical protein